MINTQRISDLMTKAVALSEDGKKQFPFDAVYDAVIDKAAQIKKEIDSTGTISDSTRSEFNLGFMAARELNSDEQELANTLHQLQRLIEKNILN